MGLFKKRFNKQSTPEQTNDFTKEPPINGGNAYEIKHVLDAQDMINKNTIPKLNVGKYTKRTEEYTYNFFWLLQFHANYFTSIFRVRTDDSTLNRMIYDCFRVHFLYGACGIYKKGELLIALYEHKVHTNRLGEITKIEFKNIFDLLVARNFDDFKAVNVSITLDKEELKNYARLRTTSIGFGAIVTWMPFVKQQESLLKKIYMYSYVFHRKISYQAQDLSTSMEELESFFNDDVPFYLELDADIGTGNKFSTESIKNGTSGGVSELKDYYNFFIESYYHLLGRRYNVDDKKERNISTEVSASQSNFDILQNEDKIVKTDFLNDLKKITGIEWYDIEKEQKEQELNDLRAVANGQSMNRSNGNKE